MFSLIPKRNYNRRYPKDYGFLRTLYMNFFISCVVFPIGLLFFTPKIIGRENLDKKKRYIYASNHQSYIDAEAVCYAAYQNTIAYMAKEELFTTAPFLAKALIISLGAFAVNRDKPEMATFKSLLDIAKNTKWSLGIFPQGTKCIGAKKFDDVKPGFARLAKMAKMDVVPVAINGFRKYPFIPFTEHLTIKIGKPISYELPEEEIFTQWVNYMNENIE